MDLWGGGASYPYGVNVYRWTELLNEDAFECCVFCSLEGQRFGG